MGSPVAGAPYNTSSSNNASNFALDGLGNAWIVTRSSSGNPQNPFSFQIVGISNSGNTLSGTSGYALDNNVQQVNAIALDGSGNIWLDTSSSLTELVGAAAPVVYTCRNRNRQQQLRYPALTPAISRARSSAVHRPEEGWCTLLNLPLANLISPQANSHLSILEVVVSENAASSMS